MVKLSHHLANTEGKQSSKYNEVVDIKNLEKKKQGGCTKVSHG